MLIDNEKKLLCATPDKQTFSSAPEDFRPHFLHGVQKKSDEFSDYADKNIFPKSERAITMEPDWWRWDDPTLFSDGDPYWEDCAETLAYLRENGMFSWIYDEPGYPSGSAGILTLRGNEALVQCGIELTFADFTCGSGSLSFNGEFISAFALTLSGSNITKKIALDKPCYTSELPFRLCVFSKVPFLEATIPHIRRRGRMPDDTISKTLLYGYPNLLDRRATELFIKAAYEPYENHFKDYLGNEIRAFFTDEPTIPFRHFFAPDYPAAVPWCDGFPELFYDKYGMDILPFLPELFFDMEGADIIRYKFYELVSSLFAENFLAVMTNWCQKRGMYFTGHFLHEEQLATQILCSGNILRCAKNMSMPGTDNLSMGFPGRGVGARMSVMGTSSQNGATTAKLISSGAHLSGRVRTASESHGWSSPEQNTSFASYIATANWQYVLGINSLPYYTMDWKNSNDDERSRYVKYASRLSYMTSGGVHKAPVCVLYPINTAMAYLTPLDERLPSVAGLSAREREYWYYNYNYHMFQLQNIYDDTCTHLLSMQTDFDYVEDCDIANAAVSGSDILIANETYSAVLLPACEYISAACAKKLIRLMNSGGKVICVHTVPQKLIDGDNAALLSELAGHKNMCCFQKTEDACRYAAEHTVHIRIFPENTDIYALHVQKEDMDIFFICNNSISDWCGKYYFPASGKKPQLWNAFDGKVYDVPYHEENGSCIIDAALSGHQGHLIVFSNGQKSDGMLDITQDFGLPKAETIEEFSRFAEELSRNRYIPDGETFETEPEIASRFSLHAPDNGLYITDSTDQYTEISLSPGYRSGEVLEGLYASFHLCENGVYRFSAEISEDNINYWGFMPRHFDESGKEILEKGIAGNWRNEFGVTLSHKPCSFAIWFHVPSGTKETKILVSPLSKRIFSDSASLKVKNAKLEKIKDKIIVKETIQEKRKVCSL